MKRRYELAVQTSFAVAMLVVGRAFAAPPSTTTRYMSTTDYNTLYYEGCAQTNEDGAIILDFGQPWFDGTSYGTIIFGSITFRSICDIENAVQGFLSGYYLCGGSGFLRVSSRRRAGPIGKRLVEPMISSSTGTRLPIPVPGWMDIRARTRMPHISTTTGMLPGVLPTDRATTVGPKRMSGIPRGVLYPPIQCPKSTTRPRPKNGTEFLCMVIQITGALFRSWIL